MNVMIIILVHFADKKEESKMRNLVNKTLNKKANFLIINNLQQKTVITRKDAQEAKIKTRAMAKANEKKITLVEAKRNSRQKMLLAKANEPSPSSTAATSVKDIYGNV